MGDIFQKQLSSRRDQLLHEIGILRAELTHFKMQRQKKIEQIKLIQFLLSAEGVDVDPEIIPGITGKHFIDYALEILEAGGAPLHYKKLTGLMKERSIYIPGNKPAANLLAHMNRDDRFVRVGRGTYTTANLLSFSTLISER